MDLVVDRLREAASRMQQDAAHKPFQERVALHAARNGDKDPVIFLRAWSDYLRASALWIEYQQIAQVMPEVEILAAMQLNIDVAETYLEDRDLVSA